MSQGIAFYSKKQPSYWTIVDPGNMVTHDGNAYDTIFTISGQVGNNQVQIYSETLNTEFQAYPGSWYRFGFKLHSEQDCEPFRWLVTSDANADVQYSTMYANGGSAPYQYSTAAWLRGISGRHYFGTQHLEGNNTEDPNTANILGLSFNTWYYMRWHLIIPGGGAGWRVYDDINFTNEIGTGEYVETTLGNPNTNIWLVNSPKTTGLATNFGDYASIRYLGRE